MRGGGNQGFDCITDMLIQFFTLYIFSLGFGKCFFSKKSFLNK